MHCSSAAADATVVFHFFTNYFGYFSVQKIHFAGCFFLLGVMQSFSTIQFFKCLPSPAAPQALLHRKQHGPTRSAHSPHSPLILQHNCCSRRSLSFLAVLLLAQRSICISGCTVVSNNQISPVILVTLSQSTTTGNLRT